MATRIRRSLIAGQWYPGNARDLEHTIESLLGNVSVPPQPGRIIGLISPHAGYLYSGQTAAYAYSQVRGKSYDLVAVLSPLHRMPLGEFAVTSASAYQTPLGLVEIDAQALDALERQVTLNKAAYDGEHSLEIQLPFLQVVLDQFTLLPIMLGASSFKQAAVLGKALSNVMRDRNALIVASTDLYHMDNYSLVVERDQKVIDAIATLDMDRIQHALSPSDCSVCGRIPVLAMLTAALALGAEQVQILHHTTSGDVTGDRSPGQYTVGYLAASVRTA